MGDVGRQIARDVPALAQIAKENAQGGNQQLGTAWAVTIGVTADESNRIFRSQTRAVDGAIREAIRKELLENWLKREIRHGGGSALLQKMAAEILEKDLGSSKRWRNLCTCLWSHQFQKRCNVDRSA
jgi:hypothetical protein